MDRKIRVYNGGNWIKNSVTSSFNDADIVVMPGGSDINPALYNHKGIKGHYFHKHIDDDQMELINRSIDAGKFVFGTCRGAQLLTARAGGWLIQDSGHSGSHAVKTVNGQSFIINSCHHQMCFPYDLPEDEYEMLAWTEQISSYHTIQGDVELDFTTVPKVALDENGLFKEPEIFYYPKIKAICAQNHFEWGTNSKESIEFINKIIQEKLEI